MLKQSQKRSAGILMVPMHCLGVMTVTLVHSRLAQQAPAAKIVVNHLSAHVILIMNDLRPAVQSTLLLTRDVDKNYYRKMLICQSCHIWSSVFP